MRKRFILILPLLLLACASTAEKSYRCEPKPDRKGGYVYGNCEEIEAPQDEEEANQAKH